MEKRGNSSSTTPKATSQPTTAITDRRNSFMMPFMDSLIAKLISLATAINADWCASTTGEELARLLQSEVTAVSHQSILSPEAPAHECRLNNLVDYLRNVIGDSSLIEESSPDSRSKHYKLWANNLHKWTESLDIDHEFTF